jgi:UDP-N-acetylglucosamine/UDP-N-acetylgalactosamine diphosphorylase
VVPKETPGDKMGVFAEVDGRLAIIEYSDLPDDWAQERDDYRRLRFWAGSPAIHLFEVDFLEKVATSAGGLPWHIARKKVPSLNERGRLVEPTTENALKFEKFIFDILPLAERWTLLPTSREKELMPLKNATGADSPRTVEDGMNALAANWLRAAGVAVPMPEGRCAFPVEISPLFALDQRELAARIPRDFTVRGPTYLG